MKGKKISSIIKILGLGFLAAILFAVILPVGVFIYYSKDLPRPEKFTEKSFVQSTKIYDRTGKIMLWELYGEEKREIIPLGEVGDNVKKAVISTEDAKFYSHKGIDVEAIVRSVLADIKLRKPTYGASTISQQLIRSTFLTREKTIKRKIREIILAIELERRYTKDQILEWYLNQIPFGPNIYGIQSASKTFFEKSADELTLSEAATLAAVIQSPSYLSPYGGHKEDLLKRKDYVLDRMAQEHYISQEEAEAAKKEKINFAELRQSIRAPHFVFYVQDYLFEKYGQDSLEKSGLKVYTSLDWDMQQAAEKAVTNAIERNEKYNAYNTALVAIDPKTGEIKAMVGSANWFGEPLPEGCTPGVDCLFDPKVNVATYNIGRQPGSSFKPFVYATAFEKGYSDKTFVMDQLTNFGSASDPYIPTNYDGLFRGPVTLRQALAQSLNVPSVAVLKDLAGYTDSLEMAKKMGITTLRDPSAYGLSLVLGGGEVKLVDMVSAYGVFATDGYRVPPVSVLRIEDSQGNTIEENIKTPKRILQPRSAELINSILSDNAARTPIFGPTSPLYFPTYDVAAKTGTTTDYKDGWIIGYTPSIVAGVWAGNNNNAPMSREPGVVMAGLTWREFMDSVLPTLPRENLAKPEEELTQPTAEIIAPGTGQ